MLSLIRFGGIGLIINKGIIQISNFIYLLCLLNFWLLVHTLIVNKRRSFMTLLFSVLSAAVFLSIKTKSLIGFYIFYEISVIPVIIIILLYGYQPEKLMASLFLVIYTVVRSLPLFLFIIYCDLSSYLHTMTGGILSIPMTLSFIVKTPIFLLHSWLPKAHGEAPIGGSMVLAGILLKLGTYGLIIFLPIIKINVLLSFYFSITLSGSITCSMICIRQGDIKTLIAYSSVVHIRVVTLGLLRGTEMGYSCALIMVIGHGVVSPFLFSFAYWLYESSHSRLLTNNIRSWPLQTGGFFGLVSLNMSVPPRLGVWAEVIIAVCVLYRMSHSALLLIGYFFMGAAYNLYLYSACMHGKFARMRKRIARFSILPLVQVMFCCYSSFLCLDIFHVLNFLSS